MRRSTKFVVPAVTALSLLTACTSETADSDKARRSAQPTTRQRDLPTIGAAVKFTCPKAGQGSPQVAYYLVNDKVTDADVKFGTELTIGNASVTPGGCTWGYDYKPDKASAKALPLFPDSIVTVAPQSDYVGYENDGDRYEPKRYGTLDSLQTERDTTVWLAVEAPASHKGVPIKLSCLSDITGSLSCVKNWPQIEKSLHKLVHQPA